MINKLAPIASLYGQQGKPVQPGEKVPLLPQAEPGKIVSATVVERVGQNVFTLEAGGVRFGVQSDLPLSQGEQIRMQVLSTTPVLELQKIENPLPAQMRKGLPLTGEPVDIKPLLRNLQNTFFSGPKGGQEQLAAEQKNILSLPSMGKGGTLQGLPTATAGNQPVQVLMQKMDTGALEQLVRQGNYTVKATLLEQSGDTRSLVRIGGESYQMEGRLGVRPGESQVLQLQSLQPTVTFLPVSGGEVPNTAQQTLTLMGQGQELPALVRALQLPVFTGLDLLSSSQQQVLKSFQSLQPAQLQEPGAGALLKNGLQQLGIQSEAMVAQGRGQETATQLKTLLAEIARVFQGQDEIRSAATRLVSTLENSQFLQASLNNDNILFPLPFSFIEKGYLMVEEGGQQGGEGEEEESLACTLHLNLEGLGDVRVNCVQQQDAVRLSFFLESRDKTEFVAGFAEELKENISTAPLLSLSFATGVESPGAALLQEIVSSDQHMLHTRA